MEQLRTVLQFIRRQYFWLLGGFVVVVGLLSWFFAQSAVNAAFETNKGKIEAAFSQQQSIVNKSPHFNDNTIEGQQSEVVELRNRNFDLWGQLYARQQSTVLKWPKALGTDFINKINNYKFGDQLLPRDVRWMPDRYRTYIKERARELPKIVEAKTDNFDENFGDMGRGEDSMLGAGRGGGREDTRDDETPVEEDYMVIWEDYGSLEANLTWTEAPKSMQMWVAQENLWVYETLLTVIAQVNKNAGATGNHDAAIQIINRLEVGRPAASTRNSSGRIYAPAASGTGERSGRGTEMRGMGDRGMGSMGDRGMGGGGMRGMEGRGGMRGDSGGEGMDPTARWLQGRYLNAEGEPTDGTDEASGNIEFKRLPVRIVLTLDIRHLTPLLVECANAPLPIEIEQVRANVGTGKDTSRSGELGGRGDMMGRGGRGDMMGRGGRGDMMDRGGRGNMVGDDAGAIVLKANTQIVTVILHGTVFIYNPPDKEAMKLPWEDEGTAGNTLPVAVHPTRSTQS